MKYLRRTSNCPKRITLFDTTHLMSMDDLVTISVEDTKHNGCYLEKESINLIHMNPSMVLYIIVDQVDSFLSDICDLLT